MTWNLYIQNQNKLNNTKLYSAMILCRSYSKFYDQCTKINIISVFFTFQVFTNPTTVFRRSKKLN